MGERRAELKALAALFGVHVADTPVCRGHQAPMDFLEAWVYDRPSISLVLGNRGGGKSFLAAFATFLDSVTRDKHGTRILGGSLAQSQQIYEALQSFTAADAGRLATKRITATTAHYWNGSDVSMLAASSTSVRGPHVATLRLDEIDEIDPEIREAAMGMCMQKHGVAASVSMTSTWHRIGGPMAGLIDRARAGEFPLFTFCAFEVLETCPAERSGPDLEKCPDCPLVKWCNDVGPGESPKAKRSHGHYAIDSLIQKVKTVSLRVFEADYLCLGPRADGLWFPQFDEARHVNASAEYEAALPVHCGIDSGVFTGGVFYQVRSKINGLHDVTVFGEYLSENVSAESNARAILKLLESLCNGRCDRRYTDPAGGSRNPVGPTVMAEYERAGFRLTPWPFSSVADGLAIVESSLVAADGSQRLWIHPRCTNLIKAFRAYQRAKRDHQWMDWPKDPQHPYEDMMDALRGGMVADEVPRGARAAISAPIPVSRGLPSIY